MVVNYPLLRLGVKHELASTRRVDIVVARQDGRAAVIAQTVFAVAVDVRASGVLGAAHDDVVLVAGRSKVSFIFATALADGEEVVVEAVMLVGGGAFHDGVVLGHVADYVLHMGFAAVVATQLVDVAHLDLLDAAPVASKCEVDGRIGLVILEDVRVDQVVVALWDIEGTAVGPGTGLERFGGCDADGRFVRAHDRDGIMAEICVVDLAN
jgi:hypothetical protein